MRSVALSLALALAGCSFDASGVGGGGLADDEPVDAAAAVVDAASTPSSDAVPVTVDAAPVAIDAAPDESCDSPADCGGQLCCQYVGLFTGCADSCVGGERVCEDSGDCTGNDVCCSTLLGEKTCQAFCI